MNGCFKGIMKLGCAIVVIAALALAWWFRGPIMQTFARWFGHSQALPSTADTAVGAPTPAATASSKAKVTSLQTRTGPDSVVLTPNEVASLIGSSIDWNVRKMYDSMRVELQEDKLIIHARLDTRQLPPGTLGPFAGMVNEREPIQLGGTLTIERPGTALFTPKDISIRGFAFPGPAVQSMAKQMAGARPDGSIPLKVDPAVSDIMIHPGGVVLYKRGARGTGR